MRVSGIHIVYPGSHKILIGIGTVHIYKGGGHDLYVAGSGDTLVFFKLLSCGLLFAFKLLIIKCLDICLLRIGKAGYVVGIGRLIPACAFKVILHILGVYFFSMSGCDLVSCGPEIPVGKSVCCFLGDQFCTAVWKDIAAACKYSCGEHCREKCC